MSLTDDIKNNIRVRAKQHINSTDPSTDHWDSIETPDGFVDFNIGKTTTSGLLPVTTLTIQPTMVAYIPTLQPLNG